MFTTVKCKLLCLQIQRTFYVSNVQFANPVFIVFKNNVKFTNIIYSLQLKNLANRSKQTKIYRKQLRHCQSHLTFITRNCNL